MGALCWATSVFGINLCDCSPQETESSELLEEQPDNINAVIQASTGIKGTQSA